MAFPNDLADVAVFKVHPAIGCARLASNDDYYEFFDYEQKRKAGQAQSLKYMTLRDGKHRIMRQAVRFRIFAYRSDGSEIGELTDAAMNPLGLRATWTANVANRKLNVWSGGATPVVTAQASATSGETKRLEGNNPWRSGKVWLGEITGNGLFIPPKGGAYRKAQDTTIPPYGTHQRDNGILDTTCDGSISVSLAGGAADIPIVPACVIVAPQDHSPDVNPEHINNSRNVDFVKETRRLLNIPENATLAGVGYEMDIAMMKTMNAEYSPGMEICLDGGPALPDPASAFFARGQQHIDKHEIRPNYASAKSGQLTAGLCSAWQTDLSACLNYWTSTYPNEVGFDQDPDTRSLARKRFASAGPQITNPEWLNAHIDMMEIGRDVEGDPTFLHGTERDNNDDAGEAPAAPFPLDPSQR